MQFITLALLSLAATMTCSAPASHENTEIANTTALEERGTPPAGQILCGDRFGKEHKPRKVQKIIDSIIGRGQHCTGAKSCKVARRGHASEGWEDIVVSLCNTNPYPKCIDKTDLKTRAYEVLNQCVAEDFNFSVLGQGFYPDGTNVLLKIEGT